VHGGQVHKTHLFLLACTFLGWDMFQAGGCTEVHSGNNRKLRECAQVKDGRMDLSR
jgi:hypothetical protein